MGALHKEFSRSASYIPPPLLRALSKSTQIQDKVAACAQELSYLTAALKHEIAEHLPLEYLEQTLIQSECLENKVQECAVDIYVMNVALAEALSERRRLERALSETRAELSMTQAELFDSQAEEEKVRYLAFHDSLTNLPNRALFDNRLEHALGQAARANSSLAVMFIDLDRFKEINDIHGHDAGDKVLQMVAHRLRRAVRAEDTVSRHGGDEFRCLLPGVEAAVLAAIARKLIDAVAAPFDLDGKTMEINPSIGISLYRTDGDTGKILSRNADKAMYRAKQKGKGFCFFSEIAEKKIRQELK